MNSKIMYIFSRTPVHVGAGNSVGVVDAPVMRERHTRIPIIPGSSLKGVLSDLWNESTEKGIKRGAEGEWLFGKGSDNEAKAGALLIGEARVLAFPVRSAAGCFAWITCPLVLRRYARDARVDIMDIPLIKNDDTCIAGSAVQLSGSKKVVMEEYVLATDGDITPIATKLTECMSENKLWQSVGDHLVIVSDTLFAHFVENACEVVTRIHVNDETGTATKGGLFNQEQVPSETMFYSVLTEQKLGQENRDALTVFTAKLSELGNILQVGGDASIGLGFCDVEVK